MNRRQEVRMDSIDRGLDVLKGLPDVPEVADCRRLRDELAARMKDVKALDSEQWSAHHGRNGAARDIDLARRALRTAHLVPVSRRAKPLFKHEPKVLKALRLPPARATALVHADAAKAMARALQPHLSFLHGEGGFRRGFLPELKAAGERLRAMAKTSDEARIALSRTTWRLQQDIRAARGLASILDAELKAALYRLRGSTMSSGRQHDVRQLVDFWSNQIKLQKLPGRPSARRLAARRARTASGEDRAA